MTCAKLFLSLDINLKLNIGSTGVFISTQSMRLFIPAASMTMIVFVCSASTTRGLSMASVGLRWRWSSLSRPTRALNYYSQFSRRSSASTTSTTFLRQIMASLTSSSACFVAPDGATADMVSSTAKLSTSLTHHTAENNINDDIDESAKIQQIAYESLSITGSLPRPATFAGIPYLDTYILDCNNPTTTKSHRVIFVLGGPGAGKGTQSERIVNMYKCVHLSVGELLRQGAQDDSYEYANLIRETLIAGNIVPVELSLGLLRTAMDKAVASTSCTTTNDKEEENDGSKKYYGSRIFLIDGFPRNYDNVKGWVSCMTNQASVLGALVYDCPIDELERRVLSRAETSGRSDDNLISARKRFSTFRRETVPVVLALERVQKLQADENGNGSSQLNVVNINASGSVDEVWEATCTAMDNYVKNDILTANSNLLRAIDEGDVAIVAKLSDEDELLEGVDPLFSKQTPEKIVTRSISNGRIDIVDGIKSIVSYDRILGGGMKVRETRIWEHGPSGWKCIGVTRV